MDIPKNGYEQAAISLAPLETDMTLEDFLESDLEGYEYVKGKLIPMAPPTMEHGEISMSLSLLLGVHIRENGLGRLYPADTDFKLGDRLVKPDVAFVSTARLPENRNQASPIAPDLAVEVVSPSDVFRRVIEKAFAYLEAGTQMVWIVEPTSQTVRVYRSETPIKVLGINDTLTGEDVVEGFSCQVAQLFE
ncbi:MAG: Uma2 family endonuclease [Candidatus Poribacteria bacterium]|nr:Uma2 family endonuclease [Candidatus Poribacteria bacterium]